eukprot:15452419-Alexandrium_andersonii.AAC.1
MLALLGSSGRVQPAAERACNRIQAALRSFSRLQAGVGCLARLCTSGVVHEGRPIVDTWPAGHQPSPRAEERT